jgi:hypothetical protein
MFLSTAGTGNLGTRRKIEAYNSLVGVGRFTPIYIVERGGGDRALNPKGFVGKRLLHYQGSIQEFTRRD